MPNRCVQLCLHLMEVTVQVPFAEWWQSHSRQLLAARVKKFQQDMDMPAVWVSTRPGPLKFFTTSVLNAEEELVWHAGSILARAQ